MSAEMTAIDAVSETGPRPRRDPLSLVVAPAVLALGSAFLFFWNLGRTSLEDWDEATYAEITREISVFHDWAFLHWNYVPWFNKAPLYIWLTAPLYQFGVNAFWARAVSALAGVGLVLITYAIGLRLYGRLTALAAAVVLGSCFQVIAASRFGTSDMLLTLFLYLALYAYLRTEQARNWWYAVGIFIGLAMMTKGAAALVGPLAMAIALLLDRRLLETLRAPQFWSAPAIALAIAVPWHLASYLHYGQAFFGHYIGSMVVDRTNDPLEGHGGTVLTYVAYLRNQFYPWAYVVPFASLGFIRDRLLGKAGSWVILVFPTIVFVLYTLVATKLVWYILPVYPALAVLIGALLARALHGELLALGALALAAAAAIVSVPNALPDVPGLTVVVLLAAGIVLLAVRPWIGGLFPTAAVAVLAAFFVGTVGVRTIDLYRPSQRPVVALGNAARAAAQGKPARLVLYIANDRLTDFDVSHGLLFYSHRPVFVVFGPTVFTQAFACQPQDAVMPIEDVSLIPTGYRFTTIAEDAPFAYGRVEPAGC